MCSKQSEPIQLVLDYEYKKINARNIKNADVNLFTTGNQIKAAANPPHPRRLSQSDLRAAFRVTISPSIVERAKLLTNAAII
jgi:hypothetical protein